MDEGLVGLGIESAVRKAPANIKTDQDIFTIRFFGVKENVSSAV